MVLLWCQVCYTHLPPLRYLLPDHCPACKQVARWTTESPIPKVAWELNLNDKVMLLKMKIDPDVPQV